MMTNEEQTEEHIQVRHFPRLDNEADPKNRKKMLATIELFNQQCTE